MQEDIEKLCEQIVSGANAVYVKGCDDIAMSNLAQLRGICMSANRIRQLIKEDDKDA